MIRNTLAPVVALVLVLAFALTSLAQGDISGSWDLTINGPQGTITAGATMKQAGEKVTGTLSSPQGEVELSGTMTGKTLKLAFAVSTPQGNIDVTMVSEVTGGEMKGTMDFGMGTADFTGKKK
jgi:hypothetical protein